MPRANEIDDILDAALDELEDDSDDGECCVSDGITVEKQNKISPEEINAYGEENNEQEELRPIFGPPRPPSMTSGGVPSGGGANDASSSSSLPAAVMSEEEKAVMDMMRQMENLFPNQDFGIDGNTHVNLNYGKEKKSAEQKDEREEEPAEPDMNDAVTQLLQKLSQNEENGADFEGLSDAMTEKMRKEFENTMRGVGTSTPLDGDDEDAMGNVVDGMMKQLLSKEFMYEPMKDICERFPTWLAENKEKLSPEDYEKHGKQYQYFQRIVHLYDHDPDNTARLTELMNDLQEYGQPPAEIVQELAPGLEFDEEGLPKGLGGAALPGANEDCVLM